MDEMQNGLIGGEGQSQVGGGPAVSTIAAKPTSKNATSIDMLMDVPLTITVELGRTRMSLKQVLELQQGAVVELNRLAGDPIDVFVNERMFARGEVVVVDDKFAVRITEIISSTHELEEG